MNLCLSAQIHGLLARMETKMKLYEEIISVWNDVINSPDIKNLEIISKERFPVGSEREMIFRSDMAYEFGGSGQFAKGQTVLTDDASIVSKNEILLLGPDLSEISNDSPYARLTIVRVRDDASLGEGEKLYSAIQKIEFVRYHVHPKGYMMRVSAASDTEGVRVSREAIEGGLDFSVVGSMYINKLLENPNVEAVKMIFITKRDFSYDSLNGSIKKAKEITKTIDHIFKDVIMDCKACNLKEICDEVEGLKELHFNQKK